MTDHQAKRMWLDNAIKNMVAEGGPHPVETCGCQICFWYREHQADYVAKEHRKQKLKYTTLKVCDYLMVAGVAGGMVLDANVVVLIGSIAAGIGGLLRLIFLSLLLMKMRKMK